MQDDLRRQGGGTPRRPPICQKDTYSMMSISMARSRMHEPNLASLSFLVDSFFSRGPTPPRTGRGEANGKSLKGNEVVETYMCVGQFSGLCYAPNL